MTVHFDAVKNAIGADPSYAWSWHCNLAMSALDASNGRLSHTEANEVAAGQMRHLFQYDVTVLKEYSDTVKAGTGMEIDPQDPDPVGTWGFLRGLLIRKR